MMHVYLQIIRTLGFDLVGEEDDGFSWSYHSSVFISAKENNQKCPIHAGETNWGTGLYRSVNVDHISQDKNANSPERNLLSAIQYADSGLVPRIGHGLALAQHPLWIEAVRAKRQCIVVMPLSNHILQYVQVVSSFLILR
jgi:adenosine deaminase